MNDLAKLVRRAGRVYLCGNGGSAANAIHIANDLVMAGIRAQALTADVATLTRIANDTGYESVFSEQLRVLGERGDLLIALSGSGRSPNVLNAIETARGLGMDVHCVFGAAEGLDMQSAEEAQLRLGHEAMKQLRGRGQ